MMGQRLALVLASLALALVALSVSLRPDTFFVGDPGIKLTAARQAVASPTDPFDIPLPRIGEAPAPHVSPFFAVHGDHAHAVTSEFFPLATAPLLAWFGLRGLYVWPALGFLGTVASCGWLAWVLDRRRDAALAALMAALGTPVLVYGLEFWEHAPALGVGSASVALLLQAARSQPGGHSAAFPTFTAGLLMGVAVLLRPEAIWFALAASLASRALVHRPTWRSLAVAAAGTATALVPLEFHTLQHFGSLLPPHVATNAGLLETGWAGQRLHLAATWLIPSPWTLRGPLSPASLVGVSTAAVVALVSALRAPAFDERRFLWLTASLFTVLVLLTAPNDGGGQWGPRYLLFAYVPLAILAADLPQELWQGPDPRERRGRRLRRRPLAVGVAVLLMVASLWVQRTAYRHVRGTRATYGRLIDFVAAHTTPHRQVVTDVWWLDQIASAALVGQNVLFGGDEAAGRGIVRRLSENTVPTVTVFRSREVSASVDGWTDGTCYFEEAREELPVRGLVAISLTHRCGYAGP